MKEVIISFIGLYFTFFAIGQKSIIPFTENGLWGYKDSLENVVINPEYHFAQKFNGPYAIVGMNEKLGVINKQNEVILPFEYEYLKFNSNESFIYGLATQYLGEYNLGIIDSKGQVLLPALYYSIQPIQDYYRITKQSYIVTDHEDGVDTREVYNQYGLADSLGQIILPAEYQSIKFLENNFIIIEKDTQYALFDSKVDRLTDFKYIVIDEFYEGLSKVRLDDKFGFIDTTGKEIIPCIYEFCSTFRNNQAIVRKDGKAALINKNGEILIDFKYTGLGRIYMDQFLVYENKKWGMAHVNGDILLPVEYRKTLYDKNFIALEKDNQWQIWDHQNRKLYSEKYDEFTFPANFKNNIDFPIALVRNKNHWGIVNENAEKLLAIEYELVEIYELLAKKNFENKLN